MKIIKKIFNDLKDSDKRKMILSSIVIVSIPMMFKASQMSRGFYAGVAIGLLNFVWYKHVISKCTKPNVSVKVVVLFAKSTFILKYLLITFVLSFLSVNRLVNLFGVILGFTVILIFLIYHLYNLTTEEKEYNATSPALY